MAPTSLPMMGDPPAQLASVRPAGVGSWCLRADELQRQLDIDAWLILGVEPSSEALDCADWRRLVHPGDRHSQLDGGLARLLAGLPVEPRQFRVRSGKGGWVWVEERLHRIERDAAGSIVALHGWLIDIGASKREEQQQRSNARRIHRALQVAGHGWWDWDLARDHFEISPAWLASNGLETQPAGGGLEAWLSLAREDDQLRIAKQVGQHLSGSARAIDVHFRMAAQNSNLRWVQARGAVVERNGSGGPARVLGTFVDCTELIEAEAAQRSLLEKFELAGEAAGLGIISFDWVRDRWEWDARARMLLGFGLTNAPIRWREFANRVYPEDRTRFELALFGGTARGEQSIAFDFRVAHADGEVRDLQALARVHRNHDGEPLDLVGVLLDVTRDRENRRELERHRHQLGELVTEQTRAAIAARDRAAQAGAIKSEFLANMSHELRTPLHAIIGFSQLALDDADELDADTAQRHFGRINASARRLLLLVDDLLDLSKLESGNLALRRESTEVGKLLASVAEEVSPLAAVNRLSIGVDADPHLLWQLDQARFAQVVRNLLMNAVKYSPAAGHIEISARLRSSGLLDLRVRDHGVGIPEESLETIFERFRQGSNAARKEGSGLGLAIARELTALHDGSLSARNHPDGGAEFCVALRPAAPT